MLWPAATLRCATQADMPSHRITRTLAALVATGVLTSCGEGNVLDVGGERPGGMHDRAAKAPRAEGPTQKPRGSRQEDTAAAAKRAVPAGARQRATSEAATRGTSGGSATSQDPPPEQDVASACADDFSRDLEGSSSAPSYADLRRGCLREEDARLTLEAGTVGTLPARVPDRNTHLTIGFELEPRSGRALYLAAEATERGWNAYLTRGDGRQRLPAPVVTGSQVRIAVPASALGGAQQVRWRVESSWLRSTLTTTAYAFDDAPNGGSAGFTRS